MVEDFDDDFNLDYYVLTSEQELGAIAYEIAQIMDHMTGAWE